MPLRPDYRWITLTELLSLAQHPNALNLDTRSVLSCVPFSRLGPAMQPPDDAPFTARVFGSLRTACDESRLTLIEAWLARLQRQFCMTVDRIPLRSVAGWRCDGNVIVHEDGKFFEVLGVSIEAPTREVPRWDQPLVRSVGRGIIGFLCQQREGILRFLVRGLLEPGEPRVRMGPTLQCIPDNHRPMPPFLNEIVHAPEGWLRFRTVQSEEGGRFYHDERLLVVVELPPEVHVETPANYMWMTLREIKEMIARNANVNIEARSLIACLPLSL